MYQTSNAAYLISDYRYNTTEFADIHLDNFGNTFNFFIGIVDDEFNWFDNPYVSVNVYSMNHKN